MPWLQSQPLSTGAVRRAGVARPGDPCNELPVVICGSPNSCEVRREEFINGALIVMLTEADRSRTVRKVLTGWRGRLIANS